MFKMLEKFIFLAQYGFKTSILLSVVAFTLTLKYVDIFYKKTINS